MADITQSATQTIISHQLLTHPGMLEGTPVACATYLSGVITVKVASIETTANATGAAIIVQGSFETSGDDKWFDLVEFTGTTETPEAEDLNGGGEAQGTTALAVADTSNFTVGDWIYVEDTGTLANSEWHRVVDVVTNTSVDIAYGLANAKDDNDNILTAAELFTAYVNCEALKRVNVLVVHEAATGSNLHVIAEGIFATDIE